MALVDDLFTTQRRITQLADVIACAIIKRQQPAADLLSKREAYAFAGGQGLGHKRGRGWIDGHVAAGRLTAIRRGSHPNSPILFSRTEIVALHEAERINKVEITHKLRVISTSKKPINHETHL